MVNEIALKPNMLLFLLQSEEGSYGRTKTYYMVFFVCWWHLHLFSPFPFFMIASLSWWDVVEVCKQADAVDIYTNVW